jgi:hypothetical protein
MKWIKPKDEHIIYEALSAIADNRFEIVSNTNAKCTSTSKGKFYEIEYNQEAKEIMSNDNMAYYRGEISYPMVAMFLLKKEIPYDENILIHFANIPWKDINQKNKNDYMKSVAEFLKRLETNGIDVTYIKDEVGRIFAYISNLELSYLGNKTRPPNAY